MSNTCERMLERILDGVDIAALDSEERAHAQGCAQCREALEVSMMVRTLDSLRDSRDDFDEESIQRLWRGIRPRAARAQVEAVPAPVRPRGRVFRETSFFTSRRFAYCAVAAGFALVACLAFFREKPAATLNYARNTLTVTEDGKTSTVLAGILEMALASDSLIEVASGGAIVRYRNGAEAILASGSKVELESDKKLLLNSGSVWVDFDAGKGGFGVRTPEVEAQVVGTRFGLSRDALGTTVEVAEGTVRVMLASAGADKALMVSAGQKVRIEADSSSFGPVLKGQGAPAWANALLRQEGVAAAGPMVPSLVPDRGP